MTVFRTTKPCTGPSRRLAWVLAVAWLMMAGVLDPAVAASLPEPGDQFVNDLAAVLPPADEDRLRAELAALKDETGVEMTVLTIPSRDDYDASSSIEAFAQSVFDTWGIGDASRNDGILVLVASDDREMRLQLGSAYDQGYDVLAQDIVNRYFLPEFRNGDLARGILAGTGETIARIARRHAERLPAEMLPKPAGRLPGWLPFVAVAGIGTLIAFRRRIGDWTYTFRRCPSCGRRGMHRHREVTGPAPDGTGSRNIVHTRCRNCDFRDDREYRAARSTNSKTKGGFGGGKSSGGGATGRW